MTFTELLRKTEKIVADNSPTILTAIGVTGTITTAYLTGKASFRAAEIIARDESRGDTETDPKARFKERFSLVWKLYIPAISVGTTTIVCIVGANRIGTRRAAAMAAAYSISERAFSDYKEKIIEKIGEKQEQSVRDEIAQDRVNNSPVGKNEVIVTGGGDVLCFDLYTGRYFQSSIETLKKAQNDLNYHLLNNFYASLNDFYDKIGLSRIKSGEEVGWNSDQLLELQFSTTMSDDERPCIAIDFSVAPSRHYFRTH